MSKVKRELDNWYREYCREHKKAPTWLELVDKGKELVEKYGEVE